MSRSTYYSLKGEVRHWSLRPVLNYLSNRGHGDIIKRLETYMNSETIAEFTITISCPAKRCIMDIYVGKPEGGNNNEI